MFHESQNPEKIDYPVCRTTTPHSTWFLDPLCTSESETPKSLYVVPWDRQLQIIPELQEAGRSRSSVHCRPVSLLDSTHTVDIKDQSIIVSLTLQQTSQYSPGQKETST